MAREDLQGQSSLDQRGGSCSLTDTWLVNLCHGGTQEQLLTVFKPLMEGALNDMVEQTPRLRGRAASFSVPEANTLSASIPQRGTLGGAGGVEEERTLGTGSSAVLSSDDKEEEKGKEEDMMTQMIFNPLNLLLGKFLHLHVPVRVISSSVT